MIFMKKLMIPIFLLLSFISYGQQFINAGTIEFEVKVNNHKLFGDGVFWSSLRDKMPQFTTTYYKYTFRDDKSVYKFDRFDERTRIRIWVYENLDDNLWYSDYKAKKFVNQKFVFDDTYLL